MHSPMHIKSRCSMKSSKNTTRYAQFQKKLPSIHHPKKNFLHRLSNRCSYHIKVEKEEKTPIEIVDPPARHGAVVNYLINRLSLYPDVGIEL